MSTTSGVLSEASSSSAIPREEVSSVVQSSSSVQTAVRKLLHDLNKLEVENPTIDGYRAILQKIVSVDDITKKLPSSSGRRQPDVPQKTSSIMTREETRKPELTLDSLRTSLRRLDKAASGSYIQNKNNLTDLTSSSLLNSNSDFAIKCWICEGSHRARDNPNCEAALKEKRKDKEKVVHTSGLAVSRNDADSDTSDSTEEISTGWSFATMDNSMQSYTHKSTMIQDLNINSKDEIIIDGGASGTIGGLFEVVCYCDKIGITPHIEYLDDDANHWYAFGTPGNFSKPERVIGHCSLPIPVGQGTFCHIRVKIIDGKVPIILGKNSLVLLDAIEAHGRRWLKINLDKNEYESRRTLIHETIMQG